MQFSLSFHFAFPSLPLCFLRRAGSCTGSQVILELLLNGNAPAAIVLCHTDEIIALGTLQQEVTSAVFRGASTKKCNHCMQICTCNRNQSRATICMVMVCYGYLMLFVWFFLIFLLRTTQAFLCLNVVVNGSTDIKPVF